MLIDQKGPVDLEAQEKARIANVANEEKQRLENVERERLGKLSDKYLEHAIRTSNRTIGRANHLAFCWGMGLLIGLGASIHTGNDPYRLLKPGDRRPKTSRRKKKAELKAAVKA